MLRDSLQALQAHQGEELAIFILPAAMVLGTWLISSWAVKDKPAKDKPAKDSNDGSKDDVTGGNS